MSSGPNSSEKKSFGQLFHPDTLKPSSLVELENQVKMRKEARPVSAPAGTDLRSAPVGKGARTGTPAAPESSPASTGVHLRVPKEMLEMSWYAGLVFAQDVGRTNIVLGVAQDSPAARAQVVSHTLNKVWMGGIRIGDALVRVGNKPVSGKNRVLEVWQALKDEGEAAESRGMLLTFQRGTSGSASGSAGASASSGPRAMEYTVCVVTRPQGFAAHSPPRSAQRSLDDRLLLERHPAASEPPLKPPLAPGQPPSSPPRDPLASAQHDTSLSPAPSPSQPDFIGSATASPIRPRLPSAEDSVAEEAAIKTLVRQVSEANRERREESRRLGKAVEELHTSRLEAEARVKAAQANAAALQRERDELWQLASKAVQYTERLEAAATSSQAQAAYHAALAFQGEQRRRVLERELQESRRRLAQAGVYQKPGAGEAHNGSEGLGPREEAGRVVLGAAPRGGDGEKEALEKLVRKYEREVEGMLAEVEEARGAGERLRQYTKMLEEQLEAAEGGRAERKRESREGGGGGEEEEARRRREWEAERGELRGRVATLEGLLEQAIRGGTGEEEEGAEDGRLRLEVVRLEREVEAARAAVMEEGRRREAREAEMAGKDELLEEALALADSLSVQLQQTPRLRGEGAGEGASEREAGELREKVREQEDAIGRLTEEVRREAEKRERMVKAMEGVAKAQLQELAAGEAEAQERLREEVAGLEKAKEAMGREVAELRGRVAARDAEAKALVAERERAREEGQQQAATAERAAREGEAARAAERRKGEEAAGLGAQLRKEKEANARLRAEMEAAVLRKQEERARAREREGEEVEALQREVGELTARLREQGEEAGALRSTLEAAIQVKREAEQQLQARQRQAEERCVAQDRLIAAQAQELQLLRDDARQRPKEARAAQPSDSASTPSLTASLPPEPPTLAPHPQPSETPQPRSLPRPPQPLQSHQPLAASAPFQLFDDAPSRPRAVASPPSSAASGLPQARTAFSPSAALSRHDPPEARAATAPSPLRSGAAAAAAEGTEAEEELLQARSEVAELRVALQGSTHNLLATARDLRAANSALLLAPPPDPPLGLVVVAALSAALAGGMAGCAVDILGVGEASACLRVEPAQAVEPVLWGASVLCTATGEVSGDAMLSAVGGVAGLAMAARAVELLGSGGEGSSAAWLLQGAQLAMMAAPVIATVAQMRSRELWLGGAAVSVAGWMAWEAMELLMPGEASLAVWALCGALLGPARLLGLAATAVAAAMSWSGRVVTGAMGVAAVVVGSGGDGEAVRGVAACCGGLTAIAMAGAAVERLGEAREREAVEGVAVVSQGVLLLLLLIGPTKTWSALRSPASIAAAASILAALLALAQAGMDVGRLGAQVRGIAAGAAWEVSRPAALLPVATAVLGAGPAALGGGVAREAVGVAGGMAALAMADRARQLLGGAGTAPQSQSQAWALGAQVALLAALAAAALGARRAEGVARWGRTGALAAGSVGTTGAMVVCAVELLVPGHGVEALLIAVGWTLGLPLAVAVVPLQGALEGAEMCLRLPASVAISVFASAVVLSAALLESKREHVGVLLASWAGVAALAMTAQALRLLGDESDAQGGALQWVERAAALCQAAALLPALARAPQMATLMAAGCAGATAVMVACAVDKLGDAPGSSGWCAEAVVGGWSGAWGGARAEQAAGGLAALLGLGVVGAVAGEGGAVSIGAGAAGGWMVLEAARLLGAGDGEALGAWAEGAGAVVLATPVLGLLRRAVSPAGVLASATAASVWCSAGTIVAGREPQGCAAGMRGHVSLAAAGCVAALMAAAQRGGDAERGQYAARVAGFAGGLVASSMAREGMLLLDAPTCRLPPWPRG